MGLIDKDIVVAEIDRRIKENKEEIQHATHKHLEEYFEGYEDALVLFKEKFLNNLEVQEEPISDAQSPVVFYGLTGSVGNTKEEPVSDDLKEYSTLIADELPQGTTLTSNGEFDIASVRKLIIKACKHGANWQKERIEEALLSEVLPCFMHGGEADEVMAKLDEVLEDHLIRCKQYILIRHK